MGVFVDIPKLLITALRDVYIWLNAFLSHVDLVVQEEIVLG